MKEEYSMDTSHLQTIFNEMINTYQNEDIWLLKEDIIANRTLLNTIEKEIAITNRKIEQLNSHYTLDKNTKNEEQIIDDLYAILKKNKEKRTYYLFRIRILETLINMKE